MAANTSKLSLTTTTITVKRRRQGIDNKISRSLDSIFPTTSIMKRNNNSTMKYNYHCQILLMAIIIMISQYYVVECMNTPCNICSNPTIQSKNNDTIVDMTDMVILGMGEMSTCHELSELGNMGFYSDELCLNIKQRIDIQILCGCAQRVGERTPSGRSVVHSNSPSAIPTSSPTQPTLVQVTIAHYGDARQGFSTAQKKTQPTISPSVTPSSIPSVTVTVAKKRAPPPVGAQGRSQEVERPSVASVPKPTSSSSSSTNNASPNYKQSAEFFKDASDLKDAILASSEGEIKTTERKGTKGGNSSKKNNKKNNSMKKQTPKVVPEEEEENSSNMKEERSNKQKKEKDREEKSVNENKKPVAVVPKQQQKPKTTNNNNKNELDIEYVQGLIRRRGLRKR